MIIVSICFLNLIQKFLHPKLEYYVNNYTINQGTVAQSRWNRSVQFNLKPLKNPGERVISDAYYIIN